MLNYSNRTPEKLATEYGSTWKHYAAGTRNPRRSPLIGE
jgi:hypothetical protein